MLTIVYYVDDKGKAWFKSDVEYYIKLCNMSSITALNEFNEELELELV